MCVCALKPGLRTITIVFFLVFISEMFAQETSSSFLYSIEWLNPSKVKEWEKNLKSIETADELLNKSNEKYLEVGNLKNQEPDEKKNKKINKLQEEAIDLSVESLEKYQEVYIKFNSILSGLLTEEHKTHPSFNSWENYSGQAAIKYKEAGQDNSIERIDKLTQANELQLQGLKKGIEVLSIEPAKASEIQESYILEYTGEDFVLNGQMLEMYENFMKEGNSQDPITASQLMGLEGDEASFSAFAQIWHKYQTDMHTDNNATLEITAMDTISETDSLNFEIAGKEEELIADTKSLGSIEAKSGQGKKDSNSSLAIKQEVQEGVQKSDYTTSGKNLGLKEESQFPDLRSSKDIEFRVQIAASKVKMNLAQIESIYSGGLRVMENQEEGYFKYQIRGYELLSDAQGICSKSGVENAYIEAYKEGQRLILGIAAKQNQSLERSVRQKGRENTLRQVYFVVQLAASRTRLSKNTINNLSNCPNPVSVVIEDGMYKYQVYIGRNLESAFEYLGKCTSGKAFIVAYKNGIKLKLHKAIQEYNTYIQ